jgi:hypothetical protein
MPFSSSYVCRVGPLVRLVPTVVDGRDSTDCPATCSAATTCQPHIRRRGIRMSSCRLFSRARKARHGAPFRCLQPSLPPAASLAASPVTENDVVWTDGGPARGHGCAR